jgi:hypothetical protein
LQGAAAGAAWQTLTSENGTGLHFSRQDNFTGQGKKRTVMPPFTAELFADQVATTAICIM